MDSGVKCDVKNNILLAPFLEIFKGVTYKGKHASKMSCSDEVDSSGKDFQRTGLSRERDIHVSRRDWRITSLDLGHQE